MRSRYYYGMRLRGFSIGCQPMDGFIERIDSKTDMYYDIVVYDRKLTQKEAEDYELDLLMSEHAKSDEFFKKLP